MWLDTADLVSLHFIACAMGVLLCLFVMQAIATEVIKFENECAISYATRRAALGLVALSMVWAMSYAARTGWQPWPPDLAIIASVDLLLATSLILAYRKRQAMRRQAMLG